MNRLESEENTDGCFEDTHDYLTKYDLLCLYLLGHHKRKGNKGKVGDTTNDPWINFQSFTAYKRHVARLHTLASQR